MNWSECRKTFFVSLWICFVVHKHNEWTCTVYWIDIPNIFSITKKPFCRPKRFCKPKLSQCFWETGLLEVKRKRQRKWKSHWKEKALVSFPQGIKERNPCSCSPSESRLNKALWSVNLSTATTMNSAVLAFLTCLLVFYAQGTVNMWCSMIVSLRADTGLSCNCNNMLFYCLFCCEWGLGTGTVMA